MKIEIDTDAQALRTILPDGETCVPLYSDAAFTLISQMWVKVGWNQKFWQRFSWLGRQLLQLPEDVLRIQEVIYALKPDLIVETGVFEGGSSIFFASLCRLAGKGRVVSIEREVRPGVKDALAEHPVGDLITLIEDDSCSDRVIERVAAEARTAETVFVFLDSNHSKAHVARELELYSEFVTPGSYIVAADGIMEALADTPNGKDFWRSDNPAAAARDFAVKNNKFILDPPQPRFGNGETLEFLTYFPSAWLKRVAR